jgi:hypothetical protein
MAEESIAKKQAIINALLRKYPELVVLELTIRYDQVLDEHPFYAGVAASTLSTEQGTTVLISSLGLKQSERELSLTILNELIMSSIQRSRVAVRYLFWLEDVRAHYAPSALNVWPRRAASRSEGG